MAKPISGELLTAGTVRHRVRDTKYKTHRFNFHGRQLTLQGYERMALLYLTEKMGISPDDIVCECENDFGKTLNIRYKYKGEMRTYLPDMYVKSKRTVVEVKSPYTLGLLGNTRRGWSMTCAKAVAVKAKGYNIILMLMLDNGTRVQMPKGWYEMKKKDVVALLAPHIGSSISTSIL